MVYLDLKEPTFLGFRMMVSLCPEKGRLFGVKVGLGSRVYGLTLGWLPERLLVYKQYLLRGLKSMKQYLLCASGSLTVQPKAPCTFVAGT